MQLDAAAQEEQRKRDLAAAEVNVRNAQADNMRQRPGIEQAKRAQSALQREIGNRLKEPRPFDPSDAYDSDLAERAQAAGVSFDPKSFGDFKNPAQMEVLDPSDPSGTKKTRLVLDRASGQWHPVTVNGQDVTTGYATPVGSDGMTASQRGNLQLGGERLGEEKYHHRVTEAQGDARITLQRQGFDFRKAVNDQRVSEQGRKELAAAYKLRVQAEQYARAAEDLSTKTTYRDPDTGEVRESKKYAARRDEYLSKAAALRQQFTDTYGYLFAPSDGDAPHMTLDQFRGLFPNSAGSPAVEASRLGITLTDTDQGVRGPASPMPRRGAPGAGRAPRAAAPSEGKTHVSRAAARAKYPELRDKSDEEVDAAIRAGGYEPMP